MRRISGAPFGVTRQGGGLGRIVGVLSFAGFTAGTTKAPYGAVMCEAIALGGAGGGANATGTAGSRGGSGGGGGLGRSRFVVKAGDTIAYSSTATGTRGAPCTSTTTPTQAAIATVTYNGAVVAQGDGGYSGLTGSASIGADGAGGTNNIGNVETRNGQSGGLQGGGVSAPDASGAGFFSSFIGTYLTAAGQGRAGFPTTAPTTDLINNSGGIGGGASGGYTTSTATAIGGQGSSCVIVLIFYGAP